MTDAVDAYLAGPAVKGDAVDAYLGSAPVSAPTTPAAPQASGSPWDSLMRQVGLTARAGVTGLTSLPSMAGDALNSGINLGVGGVNSMAGTHIPMLQMPSSIVQQMLDAAGLPKPQGNLERGVQDVASAAAGVGPFVGAGRLLAKAVSPVVQVIGEGMSVAPGMQMLGAAGAATGADVARDNGAGPLGQIGAGALGGITGALAPSAALAAARGVSGMVRNVAGAATPVISPQSYVGNQLAQTIGADAPDVAAKIRAAQEFVPGSLPTTAQAGANPVLIATEKSLANSNPNFKIGMAARGAQNNAARWDVLNSIARTPEELDAALADRAAVAQPLYETAHANEANIGPAFMRYAQIPEMQDAMKRANSAAALDAAVGRGAPPVWPTPDSKTINGAALDYTSRALGDMIDEATRSGSNSRAASLSALKSSIDDWMGKYIPGVQDARDSYAAFSSPVNTMQAGQQIAGTLGTRALDVNGLPQLQMAPFKTALTQAMKKQDFGIDPAALQALQGIGQDLQRGTISGALRSPGSDTAYNVAANGWLARQLYGQNFGGATGLGRSMGAIGAAVTGHPLVGLGLLAQGDKLGKMAGSRLNDQLAELMLNPSLLLPYLDAYKAQQATFQPLLPGVGGNVAQGLLGAAAADRPRP